MIKKVLWIRPQEPKSQILEKGKIVGQDQNPSLFRKLGKVLKQFSD
jgi:hypothetical protein